MEIPVLVRSLKSSILSSINFHMSKTVWGVGSAAVEQSRRKVNMVAQGDGKFGCILNQINLSGLLLLLLFQCISVV